MDLALNNLQKLTCHKTQTTNQQQSLFLGQALLNVVVIRKILLDSIGG